MTRTVALYGVVGGVLVVALKLTEYRYVVVEHSLEIYGGLVAAIFSALGIWLGLRLTRTKAMAGEAPHVVPDPERVRRLGVTPRELEILQLIAEGMSNREIAGKLFVSENTVKTHSRRLFDKLDARRRTQVVQRAKQAGLIP